MINKPCCFPALGGSVIPLTRVQGLDWFGTVRGRLGLAIWDHTLIDGTGGVIYGEEYLSQIAVPSNESVTNAPVHTGWVAGAGVEYAFTNNFSAKIEGLFYNMGSTSISATSPTTGFTETTNFTTNGAMIRGGANLKFGPRASKLQLFFAPAIFAPDANRRALLFARHTVAYMGRLLAAAPRTAVPLSIRESFLMRKSFLPSI